MRRPFRALRHGATVAVIAPAGPAQPEVLARVPAVLEAWGLRPRLLPGCAQHIGYLAGNDACRAADLAAAFADPEVAAILCLRGGYGSGRLLDRLDWAQLAAQAKPFIGYSDITALHAQFSNRGIASFHGPMLSSDLIHYDDPLEESGYRALFEGLRAGERFAPALGDESWRVAGRAEGRLVGGNLALIASLLGTPWALDLRDAILFIEDVSEEDYRVDRLLLQLRLAGALDAARGFLIGSFSGSETSAQPVLREYLEPLGKPLLAGWPAGHGRPNRLLPLGARVLLDAEAGCLHLLEDLIVTAP